MPFSIGWGKPSVQGFLESRLGSGPEEEPGVQRRHPTGVILEFAKGWRQPSQLRASWEGLAGCKQAISSRPQLGLQTQSRGPALKDGE